MEDTLKALKLSRAGAMKVLDAAMAAAEKSGRPVSVAVADDGGHLMAFTRSDHAEKYTVLLAIHKARAAALTNFPTGRKSPTGNVRDDHHCLAITLAAGTENFVTMEGGVPIFVDGHVVGSVAVSGAGKRDQEIAQAGADVLAK